MMLDGQLGVYPMLRHKMSCFIKPSGFAVSFPLRRRTTLWRSGVPVHRVTGSPSWLGLTEKEIDEVKPAWIDSGYNHRGFLSPWFGVFSQWEIHLRQIPMKIWSSEAKNGKIFADCNDAWFIYLPDFKRDCWWFIHVKPMNTHMIMIRLAEFVSQRHQSPCFLVDQAKVNAALWGWCFFCCTKLERAYWMFFFRWVSKNSLRNSLPFPVKTCNFGLSPFFEQTQIHWSRFNKPPQFEATSLLFRWFKIQVDWLGSSQQNGGTLVSIVVLLHSSDFLDRGWQNVSWKPCF